MSAFLVEDQTINTIVNRLRTEIPHLSYIPYKLRDLGIDTTVPGWEERLGCAMFALNRARQLIPAMAQEKQQQRERLTIPIPVNRQGLLPKQQSL
jgi:hypothetical protein